MDCRPPTLRAAFLCDIIVPNMYFWLFLAVINLFKLWLGHFLPLLGDEAYYNLWAQKLAMSYVDHPPAIAYIHWVMNSIFGRTEFAVRFGAILMILLATWLIYLVTRTAYDKKIAVYAAVLFNLIPTYFLGRLSHLRLCPDETSRKSRIPGKNSSMGNLLSKPRPTARPSRYQ